MEYYTQLDGEKIRCELCHHHCEIKNGVKGFCGAEKNVNGELKNITYGYPEAINVDPVEKKPLYHFLPNSKTFSLGTIGCNFRCPFCQNYALSQKREINEERYLSPEIIVENALYHECQSISYTYNEPVVFYPYARDIGILGKEKGLKNIFVTSGYESKRVCDDMKNWVDAANVDLKSFNHEYYKRVLKTELENVLQTLKDLVKNGIWVEVTTLVIPTVNDSDKELETIAQFIYNELGSHVPWHLSAFHPDYKLLDLSRTPLDTLERAKSIGDRVGLKYVYLGNVAKEYGTFCSECKSEVVQREFFRASKISLDRDKCMSCGNTIDGVWE